MKGKVFAFGDPNSTSGYLIPSVEIPEMGYTMNPGDHFGDVVFSGGHEQTIVGVYNKDFDAVIAIGCIIQGETRHFEFVSNAVLNGIKDLNIISDIPIILCVSTDDNISQSIDRSGGKYNKGEDSAIAALKMITFNQ